MSHHSIKESYLKLEERLNKFPQGAPPSSTLHKILEVLVDEREAELMSKLPIKPFTVETASKAWNLDEKETRMILDELASRAVLLDGEQHGQKLYTFPPPMAGFFEFSLMRTRDDIDQQLLSELFYQYMNVEEDFIKDLFLGSETKLGRVFVNEQVLSNDNAIYVLDYERASNVIKSATHIGISTCYCRHKMEHLDKHCDAPMEICMTFNNVADSLIRHNHARPVDASEGLELLHQAYEHNLVQCGENVRNDVSFICNCCGCCCEALVAAREFGTLQPVHTTNFIPRIDNRSCNSCGKCAAACPLDAIGYNKDNVYINEDICLGCGVCKDNCNNKAIYLDRRPERVITPANSVHRVVLMAIEKGQLQNLICDNQAFTSHRAMAAILSAILKLPPIKQVMASKQMKSVYLDKLISKVIK